MEAKAKVLLAEDDENLGILLKEYLKVKDYDTDLYSDGDAAFKGYRDSGGIYDICILDVMMPIKDGFTLAQEIRQMSPDIPIIFLTAKSMKEDVVKGFSSGGDDYITKPFNIEEVILRIEAILRRTSSAELSQATYDIGDYVFNPTKQTLVYSVNGTEQKLTAKEAELLRYLCVNRNNVLDRNFALRTVWNDDSYFNARSMDVYITKLRKCLKDDPSVQIINVRGKGFKLID
ncbi:MAG: response regulator transcription factor [Prevotellaceae bacterium]|jgi:DNA-binding response OmpR family regulator|nr:response regulator transcription factor [Prevotellaceae bacterium]